MSESPPIESTVLTIPDFCLVVLVGVSGSGKSTFAARHFKRSETLSSDAFRYLVSDNENDQAATPKAFEALHYIADIRLGRRLTVVIDATNVQAEARKPLLALARRHDCLAVAIVLNVSEKTCRDRNRDRPDRQFGDHVLGHQSRQLRQSLHALRREGFRHVFLLNETQIAQAEICRQPLWTDRRSETGPFDLIGDVHGCFDELTELLTRLGYCPAAEPSGAWSHPDGRRAVFLGDLVDRGPKVVETVDLVMAMVQAGHAFCVPGNHDVKLLRALRGDRVTIAHGLDASLSQIEALPDEERDAFKARCCEFIDSLVSHLWLDSGRLCAAHAGMRSEYIGRASGRVREFALYGETTGETDESGLPIRYPWAQEYRGATTVVYGHTPVIEPEWLNNSINLDTGCVFGGKLTGLRWPEREIVQAPARAVYHARHKSAEPMRSSESTTNGASGLIPQAGGVEDRSGVDGREPFVAEGAGGTPALPDGDRVAMGGKMSEQWEHGAILRAEDVIGKRIIDTRTMGSVIVPAENAAAALEVMSRFALEPRWLITLPPTMSPSETTPEGEYLEHPAQAFDFFREQGVEEVVCQRKHMGSRAILVVCRDPAVARHRFGAEEEVLGACYTRTGRQFFDDFELQSGLLREASEAVARAGLWERLETDWICLDCEIMPWNAKAQSLIREQYAPVGAAARLAVSDSLAAAEAALARGIAVDGLTARLRERRSAVEGYVAAYKGFCWGVAGLREIRIAPFHVLAAEGRTFFDRTHAWHLETVADLATHSSLFLATEALHVDLADGDSAARAIEWWNSLTANGGEGMVVKPRTFESRGRRGLIQPAIKVRGREYLRIIYGPEYTEPANLERLRARRLGMKRRLALREFALGAEALERFVRREPLRRVHECVFGVLALESSPVDPRL